MLVHTGTRVRSVGERDPIAPEVYGEKKIACPGGSCWGTTGRGTRFSREQGVCKEEGSALVSRERAGTNEGDSIESGKATEDEEEWGSSKRYGRLQVGQSISEESESADMRVEEGEVRSVVGTTA